MDPTGTPELGFDALEAAGITSIPRPRTDATKPRAGPSAAPPAPAPRNDEVARSAADVPMPDGERLRALLAEHGGNVALVARVVGRSRTQVYRWMVQLGIARER